MADLPAHCPSCGKPTAWRLGQAFCLCRASTPAAHSSVLLALEQEAARTTEQLRRLWQEQRTEDQRFAIFAALECIEHLLQQVQRGNR